MKRLIAAMLALAGVMALFTGCGTEIPTYNTQRTYLESGVTSRRIKTSDNEYLLAFYGRFSGEEKDKNRIIYLNKYNNIEKEIYIPNEIDPERDDYRFCENYVMLIDQGYWGVDSEGNLHGFSVIDRDGNIVADYPSRNSIDDYKNDRVSFVNRFSFTWWHMKDSSTMILATPVNLYEYSLSDGSLTKLAGAENFDPDYSFEEFDSKHPDYMRGAYYYGFYFVGRSNDNGVVFSFCDGTHDSAQTLYRLKDGVFRSITPANRCFGVPYYNSGSDCLIRYITENGKTTYLINEQPHSEYSHTVSFSYDLSLISEKKGTDRTDINYFDSDKMQHYQISVSARQATLDSVFYNHVFSACGDYLYMADTNYNDISYRLNIITGEGVFVKGSADDYSLCPEHRISEAPAHTGDEFLTEIRIYKDEIINIG